MSKKLLGAFAVVALTLVVAASANAETYTRDLTIGSTGSDVVALQDLLVASGDLVMPAGVSKGYFGALTKSALSKWQAKMGISPTAGYFGPVTRAKVAAAGGSTTTTGGDTSSLNGGDGDFKSFKVLGTPSSEDVYEGESKNVLGFEFTAKDSDLQIDRIEVQASSTLGSVKKPWKVLDTVKILNGSKEVADIDASDSDNWDETSSGSDKYTIKLAGIKSVVKEDDKAKFYVEVTAQDSLDTTDLGSWAVALSDDGIRALNADGVNVYEGSVSSSKTFSLKEVKDGALTISVDSSENKDQAVTVDDSNDTTDVLGYVAQVKSKTGDNTLDKVTVTLSASDADAVNTVYLYVDGDEVGSESYGTSVVFDDLSDVTIDEGDKLPFEVKFDLNDTNDGSRYSNGSTLKVTGMTVDYVDSADNDQSETETADGGTLTLSTTSIQVAKSGSVSSSNESATKTDGKYSVSFTVTAPSDEDIYIPSTASRTSTTTAGAGFTVYDSSDAYVATATTSLTELVKSSGSATLSNGYFKISSGSSATFTMNVILDNFGGASNIARKVGLTQVNYKVGSAATPDVSYTAGLDEDYRTSSVLLYSTKQN